MLPSFPTSLANATRRWSNAKSSALIFLSFSIRLRSAHTLAAHSRVIHQKIICVHTLPSICAITSVGITCAIFRDTNGGKDCDRPKINLSWLRNKQIGFKFRLPSTEVVKLVCRRSRGPKTQTEPSEENFSGFRTKLYMMCDQIEKWRQRVQTVAGQNKRSKKVQNWLRLHVELWTRKQILSLSSWRTAWSLICSIEVRGVDFVSQSHEEF